jgi:cytochrome c peroxidase
MMRSLFRQPFKAGLTLCFAAIALAVILTPSPATGQAATNFGSASGVNCPGGNVICNGSINFLTTELFFEPETPAQGLKDTLVTWNEVEYLLDNPYVTGGGGNAAVIGAVCRDGSGPQPLNEQKFPSYCTGGTGNAGVAIFNNNIRRPAFGVTHPVAGSQTGAQTAVAGLPPLRVHPINYNAPNGNEQRILNPNFGGNNAFNNTSLCTTLAPLSQFPAASCTPPDSVISVSPGAGRLDPTQTPEIDYDLAIGPKPFYCQNNPEPVPLGGTAGVAGSMNTFGGPFNTAFDSENLQICGSDPGEPGAAMPWVTTTGTRNGSVIVNFIEDNVGLPMAGATTSSWYSVPAVPAGSAGIALLRQIRNGTIPFITTGTAIPVQSNEWLVDPGVRGRIVPLNPITGVGGLKKPTLRSADVGGTGLAPNYVWNTAAMATAARPDPTGADIQFSNENDYYSLFNPARPQADYSAGVTAANFYARKQSARLEAARLGKSLFWDMQVGSDGVQSCGSCHAHAAADNRTKNQINPFGQDGISGNPTNYNTTGTLASFTFPPNHDLTTSDFPFHKLTDPEIAGDPVCSPKITGDVTGVTFPDGDPLQNPFGPAFTACDAGNMISDTDDVASSMGVHFGYFYDIPAGTGSGLTQNNTPGATPVSPFGPPSATGGVRALIRDQRAPLAAGCAAGMPCDLNVDPIAGFAGTGGPTGFNQFRRVEPRNTPTIDLAEFNFDNFWDGRARHDDNGGSVFGPADPQSHIFVDQTNSGTLTATRQLIKFTSIASLAKGPALSKFEMSYLNRNWAKIGKKLLQAGVTPLANQLVDPTDSILGPYSNQNGSACGTLARADRSPQVGPGVGAATTLGAGVPGLCISYSALIRHAYYPALWQNTAMHLNGCYTDAFVADGQPLNPAIVAVHPNQCGTGIYTAASVMTLDADGVVRSHNNDPFDTFVLQLASGSASATNTNQFTQMEGNFSLFWGQSINAWASLLVPDDTPFDKFADANPDVGMATGETGEPLLVTDTPMCGLNGSSPFPAGYVRDFERAGCLREVGNFKRDPYNQNDIVGTPAFPVQNDTVGHPRMSACVQQLTFNGETGTRICTHYVPAGGTRNPTDPDPLLGMDIFFGSNLSLKNPEFRSARCGACHNAPTLTDHTTAFTHKWTLVDAAAEFSHDTPEIEPLVEPLSKQRIISAFHLESETNGPGQDAIERKSGNLSIVPAPAPGVSTSGGSYAVNGNCTTGSCIGYTFPDGIVLAADQLHAQVRSDLGSGPVAGAGDPVPYTSFGGSFFDNGVYNIGVRPCVADQSHVTGACEDTGRGNTDAFGWPLSLSALLLKDLGGPGQLPGTPIPAFDQNRVIAPGQPARADAQPCAPYCATGGLYPLTGHDQLINSGYSDDPANPAIPGYIAAAASHISVGDSHPQLDEACGPTGGCINTLSDTPNAEGFPELGFDPRANLSEVLNASVANGDSTIGGPGVAEQGTWPFVNRVNRFGAFKAPQLREVELTGPYFHNGGKLTLRQVVDFYVRGGDFPVTNAHHRDFNILNLNAELQSNLSEAEKVALVDFLLELTDDRVAFEKAPFDHPQVILPLDGTAPESDGVINRDAMLTGCAPAPNQFGPGQQFCSGSVAAVSAAPTATGPLFLNVPATGAAGGGRIPNFLGIAGAAPDAANPGGRQRLVGAAANCGANVTSQYCH